MLPSLELTTHRAKADFAATIFYACFATTAVILRFWCKAVTVKRYGHDDWTIVLALLFCIGMCVTNIFEIKWGGMGRHIQDVPPENLVNYLFKNIITFQIMWGLSLMFVKISFLLFFSKIFSVRNTAFFFKIAMVITVLWGLGAVLASFLVCQPLAFNWNRNIPGGKCGDRPLSYKLIGVFHILTDVMVLVIPIPYLLKLRIPTSRKISLSVIFCLGFVCCIISLIRVVELDKVTYDDITWSLVPGSYWTLLEPALAIFIASLPAMAPVFDKVLKLRGDTKTTGYNSKPANSKAFQTLDETDSVALTPRDVESGHAGDFDKGIVKETTVKVV